MRVLPAGRPRHPVQRLQVTRSNGKGKALSPPGQGLALFALPVPPGGDAGGMECGHNGVYALKTFPILQGRVV